MKITTNCLDKIDHHILAIAEKMSSKERAFRLFRPLIFLGQVTGVFPLSFPNHNRGNLLFMRAHTVFTTSLMFYSIIIIAINLNPINVKLEFGPKTLINVLILQYSVLCLICQLTSIRATFYFYDFFEQFKTDAHWEDTIPDSQAIKRRLVFATATTLLKALATATIIALVVSDVIYLPYLPPLIPTVEESIYLWPVCYFNTQIAVAFSKALMGAECTMIVKHTQHLNKQIEQNTAPIHIRQRQFQTLLEATRVINRQFSLFVCLYYGLSLPMICFMSFTLVRGTDMSITFLAIIGYWTIVLTVNLCALSIPAIGLQEAGVTPLRYLYRVLNDPNTISSPDITASINTFCQQIATSEFYITAAGFFAITRHFMITIMSAIIGYFLLIVQFDMEVRGSYEHGSCKTMGSAEVNESAIN